MYIVYVSQNTMLRSGMSEKESQSSSFADLDASDKVTVIQGLRAELEIIRECDIAKFADTVTDIQSERT